MALVGYNLSAEDRRDGRRVFLGPIAAPVPPRSSANSGCRNWGRSVLDGSCQRIHQSTHDDTGKRTRQSLPSMGGDIGKHTRNSSRNMGGAPERSTASTLLLTIVSGTHLTRSEYGNSDARRGTQIQISFAMHTDATAKHTLRSSGKPVGPTTRDTRRWRPRVGTAAEPSCKTPLASSAPMMRRGCGHCRKADAGGAEANSRIHTTGITVFPCRGEAQMIPATLCWHARDATYRRRASCLRNGADGFSNAAVNATKAKEAKR